MPDDPRDPGSAAELRTLELIRELLAQSQRLVREELRMAVMEARRGSRKAAAAGVLLAAAGAIGLTGLLVLTFDATYLLAFVMPLWVSALVVGGGFCTLAALLAFGAYRELKKAASGSQRVVHEFRESGRWVKQAIREPASTRATA